MLYTGPEMLAGIFQSRFIRIDSNIYIPEPRFKMNHSDLAKLDGIFPLIRDLRTSEPDRVDAGNFGVADESINLIGGSTTLYLPLSERARLISIEE